MQRTKRLKYGKKHRNMTIGCEVPEDEMGF